MKRAASVAEKLHMRRVVEMGCICCSHCYGYEGTPAHAHHVRLNHGWGRSGHKMTIALCPEHHVGKTGVHSLGRAEFEAMHGYSEIDLLAITHQKLGIE